MFVVTFATVFFTGLALRPGLPDKEKAIDDKAVAAAIADLSALSDVERSTPAGSLAVLGEVNQIVSSLGSEGAPPSLSENTTDALKTVLTLIQEIVYAEMDAGHQTDADDLASANGAVSSCNAALLDGMSETGTIGMSEQHTAEKQGAYKNAVEQDDVKQASKTSKEDVFEAHMGSIMRLSTCDSFPDGHSKSEEKWTNYFNVPPDVQVFEEQKKSFEEKKKAFHDAVSDLDDANSHLATSKGALTDSFCNTIMLMQTGCNDLSSCYPAAMTAFEAVRSRAENNMQLREDAHTAGESAVVQLKLLLGLNASEGVQKNYKLDIPTPELQAACSIEMIEGKEMWEDFLDASSCDQPGKAPSPGNP